MHAVVCRRLLEGVFVLLASPSSYGHHGIFSAASDLLQSLISRHTGRLFLSFKSDVVNGIVRTLIQNAVSVYCVCTLRRVTPLSSGFVQYKPKKPHVVHVEKRIKLF